MSKRSKSGLASASHIINVGSYDIFIGEDLLEAVPKYAIELTRASTFVVLTDSNVGDLYLTPLKAAFQKANAAVLVKVIPPGEKSKSRSVKAEIEDFMLSQGCDRQTCIIALGGGVVGDLAGFVAATFMRGVPFIQIPTTLLAMVDSSVGGKTAIDVPSGKNLIGSFHQPKAVVADVTCLASLPMRELCNGIAEAIKTAVIRDEALFAWLEQHAAAILAKDIKALTAVVKACVDIKAAVVKEDEKEQGVRAILNFGHTVGHAVETLSQVTRILLHGEAVAIGMVAEANLARGMQHITSAHFNRLEKCLKTFKLPTELPSDLSCKDILEAMAHDKKNHGKDKKLVILSGIGSVLTSPPTTAVPDSTLTKLLWSRACVLPGVASGRIAVPGSKSLSNRALLMAAMGEGQCRIQGLLHSDDTQVMLEALKALGVQFWWEDSQRVLVMQGCGGRVRAPSSGCELYLSNAGTASRFLTTFVATMQEGEVVLTGNHRMKERPIADLVEALRANGSAITYTGTQGCLPIRITSTGGLAGGEIVLAANVSSQYVSSIMISAVLAKQPVRLRLDQSKGKVVSKPFIDMTIALMAQFGVQVVEHGDFVYEIPVGTYRNPPSHTVEGDASSASYPLALAAITGGEVTVTNVGSNSKQGDALLFRLLERMGCTVSQTKTCTTVRGPGSGKELVAIDCDMDSLTDCFMTICAVAAVSKGTTRITNIANQRVKECDRLAVTVSNLRLCGVQAWELADGIAITGYPSIPACVPCGESGALVKCHNDHRIAMSFACLGARVGGIVLDKKVCVDKTYPEFWDDLSNYLGLHCVSDATSPVISAAPPLLHNPSLVIIGMRGAGKTTLGQAAATALNRPFVDVDAAIEASLGGVTIKHFVTDQGWPAFREVELKVFKELMSAHPHGHVISCGGGIVETPQAVEVLQQLPLVLMVTRHIDDIVSYLNSDPTRPPYDTRAVWDRREKLYRQASKFEFLIPKGQGDLSVTTPLFISFARFVAGMAPEKSRVAKGTFFVSLTSPNVADLLTKGENGATKLHAISKGVDAVELRVDLLASYQPESVAEQVAILRRHTQLPIVFTVRSKGQGGAHPNDEAKIFALLKLGVRLGCEFVDMESHWSFVARQDLLDNRQASKIVASHHLPHSNGGTAEQLRELFETVNHNGQVDVVKVVTSAAKYTDAIALIHVAESAALRSQPATIVLAMGQEGKLSRVLNSQFTPVTHPLLSSAAPGQMSVTEIQACRRTMGLLQSKDFYIFGSPVARSPSPLLHNTAFEWYGLPYKYSRCETTDIATVQHMIGQATFGGASVTMPLKQLVVPLCDSLTPAATAIGAVNTLTRCADGKLEGDNTDWAGILRPLQPFLRAASNSVAVVVGAGGTARAALFALKQLGFSHSSLLVFNPRTPANAVALADQFECQALAGSTLTKQGVQAVARSSDNKEVVLAAVVCTLPPSAKFTYSSCLLDQPHKPIVFDVTYLPVEGTPLTQQATADGCTVVRGIDMLVAQGLEQSQKWTGGRTAAFPFMSEAVETAYYSNLL